MWWLTHSSQFPTSCDVSIDDKIYTPTKRTLLFIKSVEIHFTTIYAVYVFTDESENMTNVTLLVPSLEQIVPNFKIE